MRRRGRTGGNELNVEKRNWDGTFGRTRETKRDRRERGREGASRRIVE